ncbi:MAG: peptidoglycan-binding domain-containing protein [Chthoniobacterales bacterium]
MKTRLALLIAALFLGSTIVAEAGGYRYGGYRGYCGPRVSVGFGFGGYPAYRPYYGGYGYGGYGVRRVAVSVPVVRTTRVVTSNPRALLAQTQSQLANLGYYTGAIDGAYGPQTNRALRQFQSDYGLPITGRLDRATLESLRG